MKVPLPFDRLRSQFLTLALLLACMLVTASRSVAQNPIFVNDDAPGNNDGTTWQNAYTDLQAALTPAPQPGTEIRVAEGTYRPGPMGALTSTFTIPSFVSLRGGFDATEGLSSTPNGDPNATILSGDLNFAIFNTSGDAHHVVTIAPGTQDVLLEGFRVEYGNAQTTVSSGGGVIVGGDQINPFENVTISKCIFRRNLALAGGGVSIDNGREFKMKFCTFRDNEATIGGGFNTSFVPLDGTFDKENCFVWNTIFDSNEAARGGAMHVTESNIDVYNCIMIDNSASRGGAVYYEELTVPWFLTFANCTVAFNEAHDGGPESAEGGGFLFFLKPVTNSEVSVKNSIVWSNVRTEGGLNDISSIKAIENQGPGNGEVDVTLKVIVRFSDVEMFFQGIPPPTPWPGLGNIMSDPDFSNPAARMLTLLPTSPCIDAAKNTNILKDWTDLDENGNFGERTPFDFSGMTARRLDDPNTSDTGQGHQPVVDMGAWEF